MYEVYEKNTSNLVDRVKASSLEELLEHWDYSEEFFDIKKVA